MPNYFSQSNRVWKEIYPGVRVSDLHRYPTGGGAALFAMEAGAAIPEHNHPTGEHGYVVEGEGLFGGQRLGEGDAFWMQINEVHDIHAVTDLVFFATSLPRS